jgi:hypothetical protein
VHEQKDLKIESPFDQSLDLLQTVLKQTGYEEAQGLDLPLLAKPLPLLAKPLPLLAKPLPLLAKPLPLLAKPLPLLQF